MCVERPIETDPFGEKESEMEQKKKVVRERKSREKDSKKLYRVFVW